LFGSQQHSEREFLVPPEPVEEVFGVEKDPLVVRGQESHGVFDHRHGLIEAGLERLSYVAIPRLGNDANDLSIGLDEGPQGLVLLRIGAGSTSRTEGHERGGVESELSGEATEELSVLRVGPGPPSFDIGNAKVVELLGHLDLVLDGQRQTLLLRTVSQDRVEDVNLRRDVREVVVV